MFGRDLIEQVQADSVTKDTFVPVIVEKCIQAVEANGMFMSLLLFFTMLIVLS